MKEWKESNRIRGKNKTNADRKEELLLVESERVFAMTFKEETFILIDVERTASPPGLFGAC